MRVIERQPDGRARGRLVGVLGHERRGGGGRRGLGRGERRRLAQCLGALREAAVERRRRKQRVDRAQVAADRFGAPGRSLRQRRELHLQLAREEARGPAQRHQGEAGARPPAAQDQLRSPSGEGNLPAPGRLAAEAQGDCDQLVDLREQVAFPQAPPDGHSVDLDVERVQNPRRFAQGSGLA